MIEYNKSEEDNYFFKQDVVFKSKNGILFCLFIAIIWFLINTIVLYLVKGSFSFLADSFNHTVFEPEYTLSIFLAGIIFQELIKSTLLKVIAKVKFKQQIIGFSITSFMPYVHSKHPILLKNYKTIILLSSLSVLLFIFLCYSYDNNRFLLLTSFWLFFSGYDLYTVYLLRKFNKTFLVADHQELPGAVIYNNPF